MDRRRFGFPLHVLLGFAVGAVVAVIAAFLLAPEGRRGLYTSLLKLVFALGSCGACLGHGTGAARNREHGVAPFGALPSGAFILGGMIVLLGSLAVCGAVYGVMTALYGPSPH